MLQNQQQPLQVVLNV